MKKLYHVSRKSEYDYDEFSDFVCVAESTELAKLTHPRTMEEMTYEYTDCEGDPINIPWDGRTVFGGWVSVDDVDAKYIGMADINMPIGIVCRSYHAG
jgi:hypothetical protein